MAGWKRGLWIAAVVLVEGASCAPRPAPTKRVVRMEGFGFQPASIHAAPGDTVVWVNGDMVPHTATAVDRTFDSGSIPAGGSWSFVVGARGRHEYLCAFHPTMKGEVVVE